MPPLAVEDSEPKPSIAQPAVNLGDCEEWECDEEDCQGDGTPLRVSPAPVQRVLRPRLTGAEDLVADPSQTVRQCGGVWENVSAPPAFSYRSSSEKKKRRRISNETRNNGGPSGGSLEHTRTDHLPLHLSTTPGGLEQMTLNKLGRASVGGIGGRRSSSGDEEHAAAAAVIHPKWSSPAAQKNLTPVFDTTTVAAASPIIEETLNSEERAALLKEPQSLTDLRAGVRSLPPVIVDAVQLNVIREAALVLDDPLRGRKANITDITSSSGFDVQNQPKRTESEEDSWRGGNFDILPSRNGDGKSPPAVNDGVGGSLAEGRPYGYLYYFEEQIKTASVTAFPLSVTILGSVRTLLPRPHGELVLHNPQTNDYEVKKKMHTYTHTSLFDSLSMRYCQTRVSVRRVVN